MSDNTAYYSLHNYLVQLKAHHEGIWRGIRWDEQAEAYQRGCIDAIEDVLLELDEHRE